MDAYNFARNYEIAAKELYTKSLLYPENYSAKIPGPLPISSATASLRDNFSITPNINGKFLLIIDIFSKTAKLYQGDDLTGNGAGTVTEKIFDLNTNLVDQYRIVSAGVILRYYGNFNQMSGLFISAVTSDISGNVDFRNFQNIEDLTNKYLSKCVDGVKLIYTPMDNRAVEFRPVSTYENDNHECKNQYLFVIAGDLFPNTTCIRVDFYRNIEFTTLPNYREYILQSKNIPCNFEIPAIDSQIFSAPNATGNSVTSYLNNNIPYQLKILDFLNGKGISMNPRNLI